MYILYMCYGCMSNETAARIALEQLEYLKLPLDEQMSRYETVYKELKEAWVELNNPYAVYQEPTMKIVTKPAPMYQWSDFRIDLYHRFACFYHGNEAHVYATQLLELYEQYLGKPVTCQPNWKSDIIEHAKILDNKVNCHTILEDRQKALITAKVQENSVPDQDRQGQQSWFRMIISNLWGGS